MRSIVMALLLLSASLWASQLDNIRQLYEQKKYSACIDAIVQSGRYDDYRFQRYWAMSAEAIGEDDTAMSAYERVLMLKSDDIGAAMGLMGLYAKAGMRQQADELARMLTTHPLNAQQRSELDSYGVQTQGVRTSVKANAAVKVGYDTNVNSSPDEGYFSQGALVDEQESGFVRLSADMEYTNELNGKGGWFLRSDLNLFTQDNFDAQQYNIRYGKAYAGAGYRSGNLSLYLPLFYEHLYFLERDLFAAYGLQADVNWAVTSDTVLHFFPTWQQRRFIADTDRDRNDDLYGGGAGAYHTFHEAALYLRMAYERYDAADATPAPYIDRRLLYLMSGVRAKVLNVLGASADYRYVDSAYDETVTGGAKRHDENHQLTLKLSKEYGKHLTFEGEYRYLVNSSNYTLADYSKQVMMLGLQWNY